MWRGAASVVRRHGSGMRRIRGSEGESRIKGGSEFLITSGTNGQRLPLPSAAGAC